MPSRSVSLTVPTRGLRSRGAYVAPPWWCVMRRWGWKGELLGPAAAAGAVAMLLYLGLTWSTGAASASATGDAPAQPTPSGKAAPAAATAAAPTVSFVDVFRTPALLMLGVAYLFISVIRVGLATWLPMYLKADRVSGRGRALLVFSG